MANIRLLFLGSAVMLCAFGMISAEPVACTTQLYKDLVWYDSVVNNVTNKHDMRNEAKLSAMCRALYLILARAAQIGCPLSRIRELQNRQRSLFAAGATACMAARPQNPANQLNDDSPHPVAYTIPVAAGSQPESQAVANNNIYDNLDPCDMRVRNCYLQFQINLMMRFKLRNHTCDVIESFANCLLTLRRCGFFQFLKPLIIKEAISSTPFAFWEPKECPRERYTPTTVRQLDTTSVSQDTTVARQPATTASSSKNTSPNSTYTSTDCGRASFKCLNGKCVSFDSLCNAVDNCGDGSDEIWCQTRERKNAIEMEKTFIKYDCYDVMSTCTSLHVKPLLLQLLTGQKPSLDNLCKACNKVLHCAIYERCPLSSEDKTKISSLLIKSFEQLVSPKTCQLLTVSNTASSPNKNDDATTSSIMNTAYTTTTASATTTNTLLTDRTTDFPSRDSTADTTNSTSTPDTTNFSSTPDTTNSNSTSDTTNFISTSDTTNFISTPDTTTNSTSTPDTTNSNSTPDTTNSTSTPDTTNSNSTADTTNSNSTPDTTNSTSTPDTTNSNSTPDTTNSNSTPDTTNSTSTPDTTNSTSTPDTTNSNSTPDTTNSNSTPDTTNSNSTPDTTNSNSTPDTTNSNSTPDTTNSNSTPDTTNFSSTPDTTNFTETTSTVITTNVSNFFSFPASTDSTTSSTNIETQNLGNSSHVTSPCIQSCDGLESGNYQSCAGCNMFATCSDGVLYDNRPCPAALLWDDVSKRCDLSSTTCQAPHTCVSSCAGLQSGEYQSCQGCDVYLTCNNGVMRDNKPCPAGLLWNDINKRCEQFSPTCIPTPSGGQKETFNCVKSCDRLVSGDYQSCLGCSVYASCDNGVFTDNRPCPNFMMWDDTVKRCESVSVTCSSQ